MKRILSLLTSSIMAMSLIGVVPAVSASAELSAKTTMTQTNIEEYDDAKYTYDDNGNITYVEYPDRSWERFEYDSKGNKTYYEYSDGSWEKYAYDESGEVIYYEKG